MEENTNEKSVEHMNAQLEKLSRYYEKIKLDEYIDLINKPKRMLYLNFIGGLARGLGTALGFTILSAIALMILKDVVKLNIPVIGKFVTEIVRIVEHSKIK